MPRFNFSNQKLASFQFNNFIELKDWALLGAVWFNRVTGFLYRITQRLALLMFWAASELILGHWNVLEKFRWQLSH